MPSEHVLSKFTKIVDRFHLLISLYFVLPNTDKATLEKMSIPSYVPHVAAVTAATNVTASENNQVLTNGYSANAPKVEGGNDVVDAVMNSPPLIQYVPSNKINHCSQSVVEPESNSEDSSLSDSDRTLVGDVSPIESLADMQAYIDKQWSSPDEPRSNVGYGDGDGDDTDMGDDTKASETYFKAVYYEEPIIGDANEPTRMLKVMVHKSWNVGNLKQALEPYVKVPMEYFKIFRHTTPSETECSRLGEKISMFK